MKKALFISLILILFTSCENFMNGSDVQNQLESIVKEANAQSVKLVISQDTTMGTFLSSGEKTVKLGYEIEVQFNLKKDAYIFKGLKAVSTSDQTLSRDEYVEFALKESDDDKGIYKIEIKVVKEASDIMIVPDCILVPGVVKEECLPVYSDAGCEQDSTIVIAFNKPVSATDNFTLSITDVSGNSLYDFFNEPYFSSDGTVLYIPTNKEKDLLDPQDRINNRDIFVKIDLFNVVDEEGNTGNTVYQYKYRVNKQKDSVRPVLNAVRIYSTNNTSSQYYKQILSSNSEMWTAGGPESNDSGDYGKNHVGGSIYLELEGTDIGAGIGSVLVKEKLLWTTNGTPQTGSAVEYHSPVFTNQDNGLIYCTYNFNTPSDGILEIEIFAEDYSGNTSAASKKFHVLKDTMIDSFNISFLEELVEAPAENAFIFNDWTENMKNKIPVITGETQTVSLTLNETEEDGKINSKDYYYQIFHDDYKISVYWGESEDSIKTPLNKNSQNKYVFTRNVNNYVYIKLVCEDGVGNVKEIIKRMAPRAEISPSDEGEYDIANFYTLLNKSNIPFPDPGVGSTPQNYCIFIYEFTSSDNTLEFKEVRPTPNVNNWFSFQEEIRKVFEYVKNKSNKLENEIYVPGNLKIYISTNVGDFPSPLSNNYLSTAITEWSTFSYPDPSNPGQTINQLNPVYEGLKLSSTASDQTSQTTNMEYNKYGPTNKNYIPEETPLKITVTPIKSQGSCKINVGNYKTQAGINDGIVYTIHAIAINRKTMDYPEYSAQYSASSKTSELTLTANLVYKFYIEAYDPDSNTSYIPYPYINTSTEQVDITKPGFDLVIETVDNTSEEESKDPDDLESHYIPENPITDPTEPADLLVLRKDLTPPRVEVISESLSMGNYDIINNFGNAASFYVSISDPILDYTGGLSTDPNSIPDSFDSFKKNKRGNVELSYYIIPNPSDNIKKLPSYTVNELKTVYSSFEKKVEISPDSTMVHIPFGNIEGGSYTISFVPEDKYNNAAVYTYPFINNTLGYALYEYNHWSYKVDQNNNKYYDLLLDSQYIGWFNAEPVIITIKMDKLNQLGEYAPLDTARNWENAEFTPFETDPVLNDQGQPVTDLDGYPVTITHSPISCDNNIQWRRVRSYQGFNSYSHYTSGKGFYYYDYFFVGENSKCTTKNCIDNGLNGPQIISDNSVLIHTMYSNEKLTESRKVENAAAIWETRGIETGLVAFNYSQATDGPYLNKTYELYHLNNIPSGYYYTTIVHFADGSVLMTDIKQKE